MTRVKFTTCPWCGKKHDRVSGVVEKSEAKKEEPVAKNGDVTLCVGCGMLSIFDDETRGGLRFPTKREWVELQGEKMLINLLIAYSMASRREPKKMRAITYKPDWMS